MAGKDVVIMRGVSGVLRALSAVGLSVGFAIACASGDVTPGEPTLAAVESQALQSCTSTSQCTGGQSCCGGVCKSLISLGGTAIDYGCYAALPGGFIGSAPPSDNRIPDFSFAGYRRGGIAIPNPPDPASVISPNNQGDDDSDDIQAAIAACNGTASAPCIVRLDKGVFNIDHPLRIDKSYVILRGSGQSYGDGDTRLRTRMSAAHNAVEIGPASLSPYPKETGTRSTINGHLAVGTTQVPVPTTTQYATCTASSPCDVALVRTPNLSWTDDIRMDQFHNKNPPAPDWDPVDFIIPHVRRVIAATQMSGYTRLTLDIPTVDAIEQVYGGGYVAKILSGGFIEEVGVESLVISAQFEDITPQACGPDEKCKCDETLVNCGDDCTSDSQCRVSGTRGYCKQKPCTGNRCTSSTQCGGGTCDGGICNNGNCSRCDYKCTNPSSPVTCTSTNDCTNGYECREGNCKCPAAIGSCRDGRLCRAKDDDWNGIVFNRTRNSWVRRVTVMDQGMSAVVFDNGSSFNTVEETAHRYPLSPRDPETGLLVAQHRYSFIPGDGVGNLFQRCYTFDSRHSFVATNRATGPHVWLDSVAENANADQGPHFWWNTGLLYDNIYSQASDEAKKKWPTGGGVRVLNAWNGGTNHGWTGAQMMTWNSPTDLMADAPAGAMNWVVGGIGKQMEVPDDPLDPNDQDEAFGIWQASFTRVKPRSLYLQQLRNRPAPVSVDAVTTKEQRSDYFTLTKALLKWQGNGPLAKFQDDPMCVTGTLDRRTGTCCKAGCASCSTSNPPGDCNPTNIDTNVSCADSPAPCGMPDPACDFGKRSAAPEELYCCPSSCTACGSGSCPTTNITRSCADYPPPCKRVDPQCKSGVVGALSLTDTKPKWCCSPGCAQCGGTGCDANSGCCTGGISGSCSGKMPPCVIQ